MQITGNVLADPVYTENQPVTITTSYVTSLYKDESNGFCIYLYKDEQTGHRITCKGSFLPNMKNIHYEMSGKWKKVPRYGYNFCVDSYKEILVKTKDGIIAYLGSGLFPGVGKVIAERIYMRFKEDSLRIIEETPYKLLDIKGITPAKVKKIREAYEEKHLYKEIVEFLIPFGITPKQTVHIINDLDIKSVCAIKQNPYRLYNVFGITLECADAIAKASGYPMGSIRRIQAHALHILLLQEQCGSTGMEANAFGRELLKSLNWPSFTPEDICQKTIDLLKSGWIKHCKRDIGGVITTFLYRGSIFTAERKIAENLYHIMEEKQPTHCGIEAAVQKNCRREGIMLDKDQMKAVLGIIQNSFLIITGGPGTGKTTIMKQAAIYLENTEKGRPIYFMAPSGRASRRIKEATGFNGRTIHATFALHPGEVEYIDEEPVIMEDATIFCDESSMVGALLMSIITEQIRPGCRFIFVGDENQLPSVECGAVLRDLISSGKVPVIRLSKIHRQSEDSVICVNSRKIQNGDSDLLEGEDFKIIQSGTSLEAEEKIACHYKKYVMDYGIENVYCIVPRKGGYAGVERLNSILQAALNPLQEGQDMFKSGGYEYHIGDPVMHLKNNNSCANGDIGFVTRIYVDEDEGKTMEVTYFGDTLLKYTVNNCKDVTLAYAFTVHKAQGSENKIVLTYLSKECGRLMLKRNLPYTAITRGKQMVELFMTNDTALSEAAANDDKQIRITSLEYHMTSVFGGWLPVQ